MNHGGLHTVAIGEAVDGDTKARLGDACLRIGQQHGDSFLAALSGHRIGHSLGNVGPPRDRLLFGRGAAADQLDQVALGEHGGFSQDRQRHRLDVVRKPHGHIVRQTPRCTQACR